MDLLVYPMQRLLRLTVPAMRERQWGRAVVIGSSGIEESIANLPVSNAARASLAALLKTLASEVAGEDPEKVRLYGGLHLQHTPQLHKCLEGLGAVR